MAPRPPRVTERSHVSPRRADGSRAGSRARSRLHLGPILITPVRTVLAVVFFGSLAYIAWAILKVEDSAQIPMVTSGIAVLGLVFVALSVGGAIRMWQAWQANWQGQTVLFALLGGIAGMLALGCFAGALVLALVWGA